MKAGDEVDVLSEPGEADASRLRRNAASSEIDVCLASPFFHPEYSGGAERFRRYAPGLRDRGVRMHVVAAQVGAWKPSRRYAIKPGEQPGVPAAAGDPPVRRVPIPHRSPFWQEASLPRRLAMWRNKWIFESAILEKCRAPSTRPDLLIWRYPLATTSLRALAALRRLRIPMIRVVTMFEDPIGTGWKAPIRRRSFPVPFGLLDCVVVSSAIMRQNLENLGVGCRIEVLPHGVDLQRFYPVEASPGHAPLRERLDLAPTDEVVLFVGSFNERKGIDYLAAAWDRIAAERPRAHLVLVGHEREEDEEAGPSFAGQVRGTLGRGRGSDRVRFVGPVSDVEEYMRAADVFVLPSHREGMPNVVLEAFACGVPSVLTPFRGLGKELGRPGQEYVLADHDVEGLAEEISGLLADEARRRKIGDTALRWAQDHMDVEKSLDRLADLCRDVVRHVRSGEGTAETRTKGERLGPP